MTSDGKRKDDGWNGIRMHPLPFTLFALAAAGLIFLLIWSLI